MTLCATIRSVRYVAAALSLAACASEPAPFVDERDQPPAVADASQSGSTRTDAGGPRAADAGPRAADAGPTSSARQDAERPNSDASDAGRARADAQVPAPTTMDEEPVSQGELRDVLLVGNSTSGTVSFIDARSFTNLGSVDVLPDRKEVLAAISNDLVRAVGYEVVKSQQLIHHFEPGKGERFVDDLFLSPDGQTLYVSRSNLGDVAAFDLSKAGHPLKWKTRVDGFKADHAAISPDGKQLVVSATSARVGDVFDAATGKLLGSFPTGYYPHQNDYSADGKFIYNSSIGNVGYEAVSYEDNALKGDRWLVKADAKTLMVVRTWHFEYGIRPSVITRDDKIMYAQLSYLNGVIKYDLEAERELGRSDQPLSDFALQTYKTYTEYPHDSAHHGLALSGDGQKLCDCGTIDNNVAIVRTGDMSVSKTIDVGMVPYWATTTPDGKHCAVSISGGEAISIIDYESEREVAVVKVGKFPQRSRLGKVPETVLGLLLPGEG